MADQIFKKRKQERQKRKCKEQKERSETWLFVCEGSKTEPNYINSLISYANNITEQSQLKIRVEGEGKNTLSLVKSVDDFFDYADKLRSQKSGIPYAKTFVLFDKDSFEKDNFNNAIHMAISKGHIPIWSNECFELWYILHYVYYDADNGRKAYFEKLSELLGTDYGKSDDIFSLIHSKEGIANALKYSKKLNELTKDKSSYSQRVPCTQMFVLIEAVQQRLKIDFTKQ